MLMTVYGNPHEDRVLRLPRWLPFNLSRPDFNGPPMDPPPLPFQLQDPDRLRSSSPPPD